MTCGFVLVNDAVSYSSINHGNSFSIGCLGSFSITFVGCSQNLLDSGAHCRTLTGVVQSVHLCLSGALLCLTCICHGIVSFTSYIAGIQALYAV